jgi:murein DD-endopeptidase MepM/ murein hydrolase activator NlpD
MVNDDGTGIVVKVDNICLSDRQTITAEAEKQAALKKSADKVIEKINDLPEITAENYQDYKLNVASCRSLYDKLSEEGREYVPADLLKKLQKDYAELKEMKKHLEEQQAALEQKEIELEAAQTETEELKKKYQAEADKYKAMEDQLEAEGQQLAAEAAAKQAAAEALIVENGGNVSVATGDFAWPTNGNWQITSNYGWRICPFHGREFHNGLDIVLTSGTHGSPVYAISDGVITRASWYGGYGHCIQLASGGGYSSLYGHLSGYNCSNGQFVKKGQLIGYIGSTGNSTGPHLHFTVFRNGSAINPMSLY